MSVELKVPSVGESITEVQVGEWLKSEGDYARRDEPIVEIESEKATVEIVAPVSGIVSKILKKTGEIAEVGDVVGEMEEAEAPAEEARSRTHAHAEDEKEGKGKGRRAAGQSVRCVCR